MEAKSLFINVQRKPHVFCTGAVCGFIFSIHGIAEAISSTTTGIARRRQLRCSEQQNVIKKNVRVQLRIKA